MLTRLANHHSHYNRWNVFISADCSLSLDHGAFYSKRAIIDLVIWFCIFTSTSSEIVNSNDKILLEDEINFQTRTNYFLIVVWGEPYT